MLHTVDRWGPGISGENRRSCKYFEFFLNVFYANLQKILQSYKDGGWSNNLPAGHDVTHKYITVSPFSGGAYISPAPSAAMFDWTMSLANQKFHVCAFLPRVFLFRFKNVFFFNLEFLN
jgi:hypothetical protein